MRRTPRLRDILAMAALTVGASSPTTFFYGGQAVIEGVLMRGHRHFAVAARRPDGTITVRRDDLTSRMYTSSVWRLPFLRGVAGLAEMLHLGLRALTWSANLQLGEEVEISAMTMRVTVATSVMFGLFLFIGAPFLIGRLLHRSQVHSVSAVIVEGLVRAGVLLAYLTLIGQLPSVRRVFQYHGAEHKTINCFESGAPVDVEHVGQASRFHPRCGTGFIVVVALVSIIVFSPLGGLFAPVRIGLQILLVPVVASISYECIRGLARVRHTAGGRLALIPILATQRLTTREPDDAQMEVAIRALNEARAGEDGPIGEPADLTF